MGRLEQLHKLLDLDPEDAFVLYGIAQEHAKAGTHDEAVAFYDRCIGVNPDECYAYFHKARSLVALERETDASDTLRSGLEAATRTGDAKAAGEIGGFLDELS